MGMLLDIASGSFDEMPDYRLTDVEQAVVEEEEEKDDDIFVDPATVFPTTIGVVMEEDEDKDDEKSGYYDDEDEERLRARELIEELDREARRELPSENYAVTADNIPMVQGNNQSFTATSATESDTGITSATSYTDGTGRVMSDSVVGNILSPSLISNVVHGSGHKVGGSGNGDVDVDDGDDHIQYGETLDLSDDLLAQMVANLESEMDDGEYVDDDDGDPEDAQT